MTAHDGSAPALAALERAAHRLAERPGKKHLAGRMERAVRLAVALQVAPGTDVLWVNPALGNPWPVLAFRLCGGAITVLGENPRLLSLVESEYEGLVAGTGLPAGLENLDELDGLDGLGAGADPAGSVVFRSGQLGLFYPEEDTFDVVCLLAISAGSWGFGPETVMQHSLRGLRDGGNLLAGFLDPEFSRPDRIKEAATAMDFDLDGLEAVHVAYDDFAPDGLLFRLREKSGRSVSCDLLARLSSDLAEQSRGNQSRRVQKAVDLARELGIDKGVKVLIVGPTPDLWTERVIASLAGQIDIVLDEGGDLEAAASEFSFFPGLAAIDGGLRLQAALRNPNNKLYPRGFLKPLLSLKSYDLICLANRPGDTQAVVDCVAGLEGGGRLLVFYHTREGHDPAELEGATRLSGQPLQFARQLGFGPYSGFLMARPDASPPQPETG